MHSLVEWTDWHLTPQGWIPGTTKLAAIEYTIDPPPDRVCTYRYAEFRAAGSRNSTPRTALRWVTDRDQDHTTLITRFGPCPQEIHVVRVLVRRRQPR